MFIWDGVYQEGIWQLQMVFCVSYEQDFNIYIIKVYVKFFEVYFLLGVLEQVLMYQERVNWFSNYIMNVDWFWKIDEMVICYCIVEKEKQLVLVENKNLIQLQCFI